MRLCLALGCDGYTGSHPGKRLLSQGEEVTGIDCFTDYDARHIKERNLAEALKHRSLRITDNDICGYRGFQRGTLSFTMQPRRIAFADDPPSSTADACSVVLATEWPDQVRAGWDRTREPIAALHAIVGSRNVLPR